MSDIDLRWMLLNFVQNIYATQLFYRLSVVLFFSIFMTFALAPAFHEYTAARYKRAISLSDGLFIGSIFLLLLFSRWPGFLIKTPNPDEAQFISCATRLLKDPVYWRGADAATSGPLNIYILTLPAFFGLKIEYASAKAVELVLMSTAVFFLYFSLSRLYGKALSRIAVAPVVTKIAFLLDFDFIHYSSEEVSVVLLGASLFLLCAYYRRPADDKCGLIFLSGLLLGLLPYAKLQSMPMAFLLFCAFLHLLWVKKVSPEDYRKKSSYLILGALVVSLIVLVCVAQFNLTKYFWVSYVSSNLFYSGLNKSFLDKIWAWNVMVNRIQINRLLSMALLGLLAVSSVYIVTKIHNKPRFVRDKNPRFPLILYSFLYPTTCLMAIVISGHLFFHYLLYLITPAGFLLGVLLGEIHRRADGVYINQKRLKRVAATLVVSGILFFCIGTLYKRISSDNPYLNIAHELRNNYIDPAAKVILKHAHPGDLLAVWGWAPELYVDTGLTPATRAANCYWQGYPLDNQSFILETYMNDLKKSKPRLFVDAVAPNRFFRYSDRAKTGYETKKPLKDFVLMNYKLVDEVNGVRIFQRNDT